MNSKDPIQVLHIEDDPDDILFLKEVLADSSAPRFHITHAGRLDSGMSLLAAGGIDVVMLDFGLPDSRGLETLATLLRQSTLVPVVVMSGIADEALAAEAVMRGAQDYLVKGKDDARTILRVLQYAI
jgi:DNA-binding response OmpR family regulator